MFHLFIFIIAIGFVFISPYAWSELKRWLAPALKICLNKRIFLSAFLVVTKSLYSVLSHFLDPKNFRRIEWFAWLTQFLSWLAHLLANLTDALARRTGLFPLLNDSFEGKVLEPNTPLIKLHSLQIMIVPIKLQHVYF